MRRMLAMIAMAALAACGSDDDPAPGATPSPTPSPTASPSPSPSPSPSATPTAFDDLAQPITLQSVSSGFRTVAAPPEDLDIAAFGAGPRFLYDPAARAVSIEAGTTTTAFTAADLDATAPAGTRRWVRGGQRLSLIQPLLGTTGARWLRFADATLSAPEAVQYLGVTGVPTPAADLAALGSVTYTRILVRGTAYVTVAQEGGGSSTVARLLDGSTATMAIDYRTRRATFTLALVTREVVGATPEPLVTITGSADLAGTAPSVTYAPATLAETLRFDFAAAPFGTVATEAGAVVRYRARSADQRTSVNVVALIGAGS